MKLCSMFYVVSKALLLSLAICEVNLSCADAQSSASKITSNFMKLEKTLPLNTQFDNVVWSPDSKSIAYIEYTKGNIGIVSLNDGSIREIIISDSIHMTGLSSLAWSRDGRFLASTNGRDLMVASVSELRILQQVKGKENCSFAGPIAFSDDNKNIYAQCQFKQPLLIVKINLEDQSLKPLLRQPEVNGVVGLTTEGRFQRLENKLFFSSVSAFVSGEKEARSFDVKRKPIGVMLKTFTKRCYAFSVDSQSQVSLFVELPDTSEQGFDNSGVYRDPQDCALARSDIFVAFGKGASRLPWMTIDESKDKSLLVYNVPFGKLVTAFGGYGTPETNWIEGYAIDPIKLRVVTVAARALDQNNQETGLLTLWDLTNGKPLERLNIAVGSSGVAFSEDGTKIAVHSPNAVGIFEPQ